MSWFYAVSGEQKGPVEVAELESLIATGVIRGETLVWQAGMPNWQAAWAARPDLLPPPMPRTLGPPPMHIARRYAGFRIRLAARIIDGLVLAIPFVLWFGLVVFIIAVVAHPVTPNQAQWARVGGGSVILGVFGIQAVYECYMVTHYGATLGKIATGLTIITLQGKRPGPRQSLIRFGLCQGVSMLGLIPSILLPPLLVGSLNAREVSILGLIPIMVGPLVGGYALSDATFAGIDARKQSLHDRFAETLVIYK